MFSVIMLIVFLQDGKIYCYEALLLVLFYVFYVLGNYWLKCKS